MGIATLGVGDLLSKKAIDALQANEQLLTKLDPSLLVGEHWQLWPEDQAAIHLPTLASYFTTLTHLPALMDLQVLSRSVAEGVRRRLFAFALGDADKREFDTILFNKEVDKSII